MSLDQLRYFVTVAEEKSVTKAAQRLHISQPPLTRQIKALEVELGAPLFERLHRGVRLLPAGERLLQATTPILAAIDSLPRTINGGEYLAASRTRSTRTGVDTHVAPKKCSKTQ